MNAFLSHITNHLIASKGIDNLSSETIVLPSRRAILFIKDCFRDYMRANGLQGPVQLPQLTTLVQLFDDLSPRYKADEIQLVCTLYRVYCDVLKETTHRDTVIPLDVFYGWGRQLVQDFSNIDKAYPLVQPLDFLHNTASARKLEHLHIDPDVRERLLALVSLRGESTAAAESKRHEFECIWEQLPLIYTRYQTALGAFGYEGARMRDALEHWDDDAVQRKLRNRHFVFAGFNYLVPAEKQLMHRLQDAGQAAFYWDYPDRFSANTKAFKWIMANAREFGVNELPVQTWQPKQVEVVCAASLHGQTQYVYQWLKLNHHRGERTAVVICDESVLEQVIYALPDDEPDDPKPRFRHINITKGFPMRQTDIYVRLMAVLQQKQDPLQPFDWQTVMAQLFALVDGEADKYRNSELDIQDLSWHELLAREAAFQLRTALNRFRLLLAKGVIPTVTNLRTLRLLLRRYLESVSFPFHGEPLADVQVTGVLETRALDFDNVLLLNVEEGVVPNVSADLSYLPYYLRKAYGLQTHEESTDVYAYNFFRLIYRANKVTMLFTGSESRNAKKTMSRFIRQMMASEDFVITKKLLTESNTLDNPVLPVAAINAVNHLSALNSRLSPSALNTFRDCRMCFLLKYMLKVKEPDEVSVLLNSADIGNLVHNSMQELYNRYPSPADVPDPLPFADLQTLCIDGNHPLELSAVRAFITRIVQTDKQLAKNHNLRILATETEAFMNVSVDGYDWTVGGRIDRVDELDGVIRIVDYKTGAYKDDYDWQTRIYRAAYMQQTGTDKVAAVLYLCKAEKTDADDVQKTVETPLTFDKDLHNLLHELVDFAQRDFSAMTADELAALRVDKMDDCAYCPYKNLCNRNN